MQTSVVFWHPLAVHTSQILIPSVSVRQKTPLFGREVHSIFQISEEIHFRFCGFIQIIGDNRRHRELRKVGAAEYYDVDADIEGDEFIYPPAATRFC